MPFAPERAIQESVRTAVASANAPLLLAVSGGLDSMTLLDVTASVARAEIAAVATFDHGTGERATQAVAHVVQAARRRGLPVITGQMGPTADRSDGLEAMWRSARHAFLRKSAAELGARVTTAHTCDDQIETVLMRIMRGSGARGLAGLEAPSAIVRPLLRVRRETVERYALGRRLTWVEDPSNATVRFLRNRLRLEILPALRRADVDMEDTLLEVGRVAAAWRVELEAVVDRAVRIRRPNAESLVVALSELAGYDRDSVAVMWGAIAGRLGLALDRRGTHRCAAFTLRSPVSGAIPLSGGWQLSATRGDLVLQRQRGDTPGTVDASTLPAVGALRWGGFRFESSHVLPAADGWSATLGGTSAATVRAWRPGDRLAAAGGNGPRRVKRYLTDAGLRGSDRDGWPVVLQDDVVVWIPGVRRSDAVITRSGGPARRYVCERTHG